MSVSGVKDHRNKEKKAHFAFNCPHLSHSLCFTIIALFHSLWSLVPRVWLFLWWFVLRHCIIVVAIHFLWCCCFTIIVVIHVLWCVPIQWCFAVLGEHSTLTSDTPVVYSWGEIGGDIRILSISESSVYFWSLCVKKFCSVVHCPSIRYDLLCCLGLEICKSYSNSTV